MVNEISVLSWRVTRGIPGGVHVWFDPTRESVRLFRVPTDEQQELGTTLHSELAEGEDGSYLDKVGSVSASGPGLAELTEDDFTEGPAPDEELDLPF